MIRFEEINYYKMEWNLFLLCLETVWLIKRVHDKEEREFSPMQGSFLDLRTSRIILPKEIETRLWETFFSSLTVHFICLLKSSTRKREKQTKQKKTDIFRIWVGEKEGEREGELGNSYAFPLFFNREPEFLLSIITLNPVHHRSRPMMQACCEKMIKKRV